MKERVVAFCPFCNGDIDGCCFCDHSGRIYVGEDYFFKTQEDLKPFQKEFVKESDLKRLYDAGAFNPINHSSKP